MLMFLEGMAAQTPLKNSDSIYFEVTYHAGGGGGYRQVGQRFRHNWAKLPITVQKLYARLLDLFCCLLVA